MTKVYLSLLWKVSIFWNTCQICSDLCSPTTKRQHQNVKVSTGALLHAEVRAFKWPDSHHSRWRYQMEICPRYWPFVRGIHRWPVDSPHKDQWLGTLIFFFICTWTDGWVNYRDAGDLRRHRAHYYVTVMFCWFDTQTLHREWINTHFRNSEHNCVIDICHHSSNSFFSRCQTIT